MKKQTAYSLPEEIVNMSTHGVGLAMALAVCIYFLVRCSGSWLVPFSLAIPASRAKAKAAHRRPALL